MSNVRQHMTLSHFLGTAFLSIACITPAIGCSPRNHPTEAELVHTAKSVFVAHVFRTEEEAPRAADFDNGEPHLTGSFRIIEIIKGAPPEDGKVRDRIYGPGNCSLGLRAGFDYVFFIQESRMNMVLWPTGSRVVPNLQSDEAVHMLLELRALGNQ